jgi:hypothetical protein
MSGTCVDTKDFFYNFRFLSSCILKCFFANFKDITVIVRRFCF